MQNLYLVVRSLLAEKIEAVLELVTIFLSNVEIIKNHNMLVMYKWAVEKDTNHESGEGGIFSVSSRQIL